MNTFDVFISYSASDRSVVKELAARLEEEGLRPWFDETQIGGGDLLVDTIQQGLAACRTCAVFVGPTGIGRWQAEEIRIAIERRATESHEKEPFRVITILLPNVTLAALDQWSVLKSGSVLRFPAASNDAGVFHRLVQAIRGTRLAEPIAEEEAPYRGLEAFEEKHGRFFFGRGVLTERLVAELNKVVATNKRLLAVLGPSGSGKSSLARAGLMRMVRAGASAAKKGWKTATFRPGFDPLESLALTLADLGACPKSPGDVRRLRQDLLSSHDTLHLAARLLVQNSDESRLLLLIDQFEELFTWAKHAQTGPSGRLQLSESADGLIRNLLYAISVADGPTSIALTLRTDFLGKCGAYPEFAAILSAQSVVVGPMTDEELREAIEMPARLANCDVNADLVQALLSDVRKAAGGLPLLQDVLLELWQKREGGNLTLATYEALGGLEGALEVRANAVLTRLEQETPGIKNLCRKIFLRLVQPGEGTADTRKRVLVGELLTLADSAAILSLIDVLAGKEARLLVTESDPRQPERAWVEVSHETLISQWSELRKWIEADRPGFRLRHRLTEAATDWKANHADRSYLYTGTRLALAEDWIEDHGGELTRLERRFLRTSQALRRREQEAQRKEQFRQLDQAKALAEEQQHLAEEQAKRADAERYRAIAEKRQAEERVRRVKVLWGLGIVAALAMIGLITAVRISTVAEARRLARQALSELAFDPQLGVADAARATRKSAPEGQDVLRLALWESRLAARVDGFAGRVLIAAISPDGKRIAAGDLMGVSRLYDLQHSSNRLLVPSHASAIKCLQFSPNSTLLLSASADHTVRIRQAVTGQAISTFTNHTASVRSAEFSRDSRWVVSASLGDDGFWVWQATNPVDHVRFSLSNEVAKVIFNPAATLLASGAVDGTVLLWKWPERQIQSSVNIGHPVRDLAFSPDGSHLIVASADQVAQVFAAPRMEPESRLRHRAAVRRASFSPNGDSALTLTEDGVVWNWNWKEEIVHFNLRQSDRIVDAHYSPEGEFIITSGLDRTAQVWSGKDGRSLAVLKGHDKQVNAALFSPNSQWILTASDDRSARVWALRLGRGVAGLSKIQTALIAGAARVFLMGDDQALYLQRAGSATNLAVPGASPRAVLSQDGEWVGQANGAGARLWNSSFPQTTVALTCPARPSDRVAVSSNGWWVAAFNTNGLAALWRRDSPDSPVSHSSAEPHSAPIDVVSFSPDARSIFTVSEGTNCLIRDPKDWRGLERWVVPAKVLCATFSPDGGEVALGCENGLAFIWNRRKNELGNPLVGHSEAVRTVAYSPNGQFLATGAADRTARLWVCQTGFCFAVLQGQVAPLLAVGFGSNSESIVTISESGMIRTYSCPECCPSGQLLQRAADSVRSDGRGFSLE